MRYTINGIITVNVDVIFRGGNNFHCRIAARDVTGELIDLGQYPDIRWRFFNPYDKDDIRFTARIGDGIVIIDKMADVFISPAQLPQGETKHEFELAGNLDLMAGNALYGDYYNNSFISYSDNARAEGAGLTIDILGDITSSQLIDLDATIVGNLVLDQVYKVQDV